MNIKFYAPHWGNVLPFPVFCSQVKAAGYAGVEMPLPLDQDEKQELLSCLRDHDLELIGQYWQSLEKNLDEHAKNYAKHLRNLAEANPVFINCQTGKDFYSFEQNNRLFELASQIAEQSGLRILHETHRGKCLYAANITFDYLTRLPDLRITLDISHWCNVHESLLADQEEEVALAIAHTDHIHSRVGHPEGPQVNDPRAPEWASTLQAHLEWWDRVVATHEREKTSLTVTTEFGPASYMPTVPFTQMPLANQWEINVHMMDLLKSRYSTSSQEA
jgi:sugar phosphate isomerase/epimerase